MEWQFKECGINFDKARYNKGLYIDNCDIYGVDEDGDLTYDIGKFVYFLDRDMVVMVKIYNDNINVYPDETIKAMEENLLENIKTNFKRLMVEQETIDITNE